jgi:hypothetical protein
MNGPEMKTFVVNFFRKISYLDLWIVFLITGIHLIAGISGFHCFRMDGYMQISQTNFPKTTPFWEMLFFFHGNPPLLSVTHHFAQILFPSDPVIFFDLFLPILHAGAFLLFRSALVRFGILRFRWIPIILFVNPLIFIYFRYPFYSCLLFFLNTLVLFLLSGLKQKPTTIYWIASVFSIQCLLRASYSPLILIPFILYLAGPIHWRKTAWIVLLFIPPLTVQTKNYFLVGKFTSSTWTGMNLARGHLPWNVHNALVEFIPTFSMPDKYFELLKNEPRVAACTKETNYYLSQNNLNHSVIPVISDLYSESIKKEFSFTWSLNTVLNGFLILFKSPANYAHLRQHIKEETGFEFKGWNPDFWEPLGLQDRDYNYLFFQNSAWDPEGYRWMAVRRISLYTVIYPFLLFYFGRRYWKSGKEIKAIYFLTVFFTIVYMSVDVLEANRMRMEFEVFFYFFALLFVNEKFVGVQRRT